MQSPAPSIGSTRSSTAGQYRFYKIRPGTLNFGRDYEFRMTALMALRCIRPDVEAALLAFNADGCADFDDLIIYRKLRHNERANISLIQLKHKDVPTPIQLNTFFNKSGDFSLNKYQQSYNIVSENQFQSLTTLFVDINMADIELILYTNREFTQCDTVLTKCDETDQFLLTNEWGKIYKFNTQNDKLQSYNIDFLNKLKLFVQQTNVELVNQLIATEIKNLVPGSDKLVGNVIEPFVLFITSWAKGGHYLLTNDNIVAVLKGLLLDSWYTKFSYHLPKTSAVTNNENETELLQEVEKLPIFNDIMNKFDVTLISTFDSSIIKYLLLCINRLINPRRDVISDMTSMVDSDNYKEFEEDFPNLKHQISTTKRLDKTLKLLELYQTLWRLGHVPLPLVVTDEEEYSLVLKIISSLKTFHNYIILTEFEYTEPNLPLTNQLAILTNMSALGDYEEFVLGRLVKMQDRGSIMFNEIVENITDFQKHISTRNIIEIFNNSFNVGNALPKLPNYYIPQSLSKVLLEFNVFNLRKDAFLVYCDDLDCFKNSLSQFKLKSDCLLFDNAIPSDNFINSKKCLIMIVKNRSTFCLTNKLLGRNTHRLYFHPADRLEWLETFGSITNLRLQTRFDPQRDNKYLVKTKFPNPVNVISAAPGMGKSVAMTAIASGIPLKNWIMRIDLNKHVDYFDTLNTPEIGPCLMHFYAEISNEPNLNKNKIHQLIFEKCLEEKRVVILLDGFDEISTDHKDVVVDMIQSLQNAKYPMWITTRPVMCSHLENKLNLVAYTLNGFNKVDQINFFKNYFNGSIPNADSSKIDKFIKELIDGISRLLSNDKQDLFSIPLQINMLAEIYLNDCKKYLFGGQFNFENNLDLLALYQQFVEMKKKEFKDKFGPHFSVHVLNQSEEAHMLFELQVLFKRTDLRYILLEMKDKLKVFVDNVRSASNNIGIVTLEYGTHVSFIHRSFAEYYAALWIKENDNNKSPYQATASKLKKKLLKPVNAGIYNFLSKLVVKTLPLHTAVMNAQLGKIDFYLNADKNTVNVKDLLGRTPLHVINRRTSQCNKTKSLSELYEKFDMFRYDKDKYDGDEIKIIKLLLQKGAKCESDVFGYNPSEYAIQNDALGNLNEMVPYVKNIKIPRRRRIFYLYESAKYGFITLLMSIFNKYRSMRGKVNNPAKSYGWNLFNYAAIFGQTNIIKFLLTNNANVNIMTRNGYTALHAAAFMGHTETVSALLDNNADQNKKGVLGSSALHLAAQEGHLDVVELLLERGASVRMKTNNGRTVLHKTVLCYNETFNNEWRLRNAVNEDDNEMMNRADLSETVIANKVKILELLLRNKNVDVTPRDDFNKTPRDYVFQYGYTEMEDAFSEYDQRQRNYLYRNMFG